MLKPHTTKHLHLPLTVSLPNSSFSDWMRRFSLLPLILITGDLHTSTFTEAALTSLLPPYHLGPHRQLFLMFVCLALLTPYSIFFLSQQCDLFSYVACSCLLALFLSSPLGCSFSSTLDLLSFFFSLNTLSCLQLLDTKIYLMLNQHLLLHFWTERFACFPGKFDFLLKLNYIQIHIQYLHQVFIPSFFGAIVKFIHTLIPL